MLNIVNHDKKFYDTSSLLIAGEDLFKNNEPFIISSVTFNELEKIKTSSNKDADVKYSARILLRLLEEYSDLYEVVIHTRDNEEVIKSKNLDITDDTRILSDAYFADKNNDIVFVTNDLSLKHIANLFFGNEMIESIPKEIDNYTGYKEVISSDDVLERFYQDSTKNYFDLLIGQYLILKNESNEVIDIRVWTGNDYRFISSKPFKSKQIGKISPFNDDIYQKLAFDSLRNNQITMLRGSAGSGKSICAMAYLFQELENHNLDKIIIFCNPVATINSARLGFYPGSKNDKLLDSQIGNFLIGKLGGSIEIERLINEEKLLLLPFSDIRGFDTSNLCAGVYITEAQNLDRTLIKLALQRIGENCKCILDGDDQEQVDLLAYSGDANGMRRVSKVFRGQDIYGEVKLSTIYRSKLCNIANNI